MADTYSTMEYERQQLKNEKFIKFQLFGFQRIITEYFMYFYSENNHFIYPLFGGKNANVLFDDFHFSFWKYEIFYLR